jgi:hypothetical protein
MFIDSAMNPKTRRSSGARCCSGTRDRLTFRSAGARRNLLEVPRSINIASLRDGESGWKKLLNKPDAKLLYYSEN